MNVRGKEEVVVGSQTAKELMQERNNGMKRLVITGLVLTLVSLGASSARAERIIDTFCDALIGPASVADTAALDGCANQGPLSVTPIVTPASSALSTGAAIGGSRELLLEHIAASPAALVVTSNADVDATNDGQLTFNTPSRVDARLTLRWDGAADGAEGFGLDEALGEPLNLKAHGGNSFKFLLSGLDVSLAVELELCNADGSDCITDAFSKDPSVIPPSGIFEHFFTDLKASVMSQDPTITEAEIHAILENIGSLELRIRATNTDVIGSIFAGSIDLQVNQIEIGKVIPEPATVSLLGIGLAGLALGSFLRRRRQR